VTVTVGKQETPVQALFELHAESPPNAATARAERKDRIVIASQNV
jgi:hypothetical protein